MLGSPPDQELYHELGTGIALSDLLTSQGFSEPINHGPQTLTVSSLLQPRSK